MVGCSEKVALEEGLDGGEGLAAWTLGREIQAEGTARAKAQGWECAWPARDVSKKPEGLERRV